MSDWPWFICPACEKGKRCAQHANAVPNETPYQTLTRWGSISLLVRANDANSFRRMLRGEARADRLRIRTYATTSGYRDLTFVIAQLGDYTLSEEERIERMGESIKDFSWEKQDDPGH